MTIVVPASDSPTIPGITHLFVDGHYTPLLKCPFCNSLRNIHVEVIEQHIRNDHPGKRYHVSEFYHKVILYTSTYGPNIPKEEIKLPWIRCLFCSYRDKIELDLSLHMLKEHKHKLLQLQIPYRDHANLTQSDWFARFYGRIEYRLDKTIEIAKRRGQVERAIEAATTG
ncbi:MAG: hypothetical protein ACHQ1D_02365 [Nitrososphaerales archaeon]